MIFPVNELKLFHNMQVDAKGEVITTPTKKEKIKASDVKWSILGMTFGAFAGIHIAEKTKTSKLWVGIVGSILGVVAGGLMDGYVYVKALKDSTNEHKTEPL